MNALSGCSRPQRTVLKLIASSVCTLTPLCVRTGWPRARVVSVLASLGSRVVKSSGYAPDAFGDTVRYQVNPSGTVARLYADHTQQLAVLRAKLREGGVESLTFRTLAELSARAHVFR